MSNGYGYRCNGNRAVFSFFFFLILPSVFCFLLDNAACSGGPLYACVCSSFTCMTICGISIKIFNRLELKKKKKQLWLCDCTHTVSHCGCGFLFFSFFCQGHVEKGSEKDSKRV